MDVTIATCPGDPSRLGGAGLTDLTSGWFIIDDPCHPFPPGKCLHGVICAGIAKDDPNSPNFPVASSLALQASEDYLNQILDAEGVAGNAKAIKALMGINGTLGMVIDSTESMDDDIGQVKTQVEQIVSSLVNSENPARRISP